MIFAGDVAIPYKNAIQLRIPEQLAEKRWFVNLEGSVIDNSSDMYKKQVVFNDKKAIKSLTKEINISGVALANNHIMDVGSFNDTVSFLKEQSIPYCGMGKNIAEASSPMVLEEDGKKIIIINFGWEVIQCRKARKNSPGVNSLTKDNALNCLSKIKQEYPDGIIIFFMHWSYELENYPQPRERELAKTLIDLGADGIIGSHSHRIGCFELYKSRPIVYGLGNWIFKQNYYWNKNLRFPDFCDKELVFEWDFGQDNFTLHFFEYNKGESIVSFHHSTEVEHIYKDDTVEYMPFLNSSNSDYKNIYKKNRYHRKKWLVIYYWEDTKYIVFMKNVINKMRSYFVTIIKKLCRSLQVR